MHTYKDAHYRSIIKTITWRIVATTTTMLIVFVFTGKLILSLGVGVVEVAAKVIFYYFHERLWGLVGFGKEKHPLAGLSVKNPLNEEEVELIKSKLKDMGYLSED